MFKRRPTGRRASNPAWALSRTVPQRSGLSPNQRWQDRDFHVTSGTAVSLTRKPQRDSLSCHRRQRRIGAAGGRSSTKIFPHRAVEAEQGARHTTPGLVDVCVMHTPARHSADMIRLQHRCDVSDITQGSAVVAKVRSDSVEGLNRRRGTPRRCTILSPHPFLFQPGHQESACYQRR